MAPEEKNYGNHQQDPAKKYQFCYKRGRILRFSIFLGGAIVLEIGNQMWNLNEFKE